MLLPESSVPDGPDVLSVLFHVGAYGALAFTLVRPGGLQPAVAVALVLASGIATEALQALTPDRSTDPWDVAADLLGGLAGAAAAGALHVDRVRRSRGSGAGAGRSGRRSRS